MFIKAAGIVSALAIMAALSGAAYAQTANSESNSSSGAASQSGSSSVSRGGNATGNSSTLRQGVNTNVTSGVTIDQRSSVPETQRSQSGVNYTGGTNNYDTSRQTGDVTIRTTPQVYAPPVSGGNPCTLAVSGGISVIGWGAAAGGTFVDQDCANRQKIAMIHNSGRADLAFALMCNDRDTYNASKRTTAPCAVNSAFEPAGAPPMVQQQPGPVVVTPTPVQRVAPMAAKEYPRCNPRAGIVDNCRS